MLIDLLGCIFATSVSLLASFDEFQEVVPHPHRYVRYKISTDLHRS